MILLYAIRNKHNGKLYIGQTVQTLHERFRGHLWDAAHGGKMAVHCALRKYGPDSFEIVQLCVADNQEQADHLETAFIVVTKSHRGRGYNMTYGGKVVGSVMRKRNRISRQYGLQNAGNALANVKGKSLFQSYTRTIS